MIHSLIHPRTTALACGLALFSGLLPLSARAQEALERTLTVTGVGEVAVETTITRIQLGVEVRGATAAEVQAAVAERTTAVVDLLRSRAVERLQTTGIRLQPDYTFENRQRRLVGYVGTNSVASRFRPLPLVRSSTRRFERATQIDGINFLADEAAITTAEQAALREATADARQQADVVLDSLGLSAQEIVRIHINDNQTAPLPRMQNAMLESAPADTPVIGGQQLVQASVTLEIGY
ncbi:MAG: SIMPL domain-containing protein [Spirulinaceae cyanobacterium RM2_2_10]|nr:SIMPL domain-containing protein [Spirulinaceae cyanobacterium RM2_2_10]